MNWKWYGKLKIQQQPAIAMNFIEFFFSADNDDDVNCGFVYSLHTNTVCKEEMAVALP